jgi:hypothetical protein
VLQAADRTRLRALQSAKAERIAGCEAVVASRCAEDTRLMERNDRDRIASKGIQMARWTDRARLYDALAKHRGGFTSHYNVFS